MFTVRQPNAYPLLRHTQEGGVPTDKEAIDIRGHLRDHAEILAALVGTQPDYTVSNATPNRTLDVSTVTLTQLANVVSALINDLIDKGVLK